MQKQRW